MTTLSLAGTWRLRATDETATLPVQVPGDVHSALLAAGRIPDPYYGMNEKVVQWVGEKDWTYERSFEVGAELLARRSVVLDIEHPDTFAAITINGQAVGETANRFRRYRFEVRPLLKAGTNTITATFRSAEKLALARGQALPYPVPHIFNEDGIGPSKRHFNLIRKTQCHGGWDWGISLMQIGFPSRVQLVGADQARIDYVGCDQHHEAGRCTVTVTAEAVAPVAGRAELSVRLGETTVRSSVELAAGSNRVSTQVVVDQPRLWWPNGYGEQPLYELEVRLGEAVCRKQLGLRTIEVLNRPDQWGTSLALRVNGVDVFAKGANWIPADALNARQTPERYDALLADAAAANMNIIRVWGGGQFEEDAFYQACDRLGLMIWHDFMFSCALYPADKAFLGEVRAELAHQLKRLRDHASIALWCGDNECVGAINWFKEAKANRDRYLLNYDRLSRVLAESVEEHDPARMFWPSSPCAGPGDFRDCWHDDGHGDMHFWSVWHESKDFEHYHTVKPRFCSEFGFQSYSSLATARSFCPDDQLNPTAPLFEHHQKNVGGNSRILETMARYFRMPLATADILYLSQLQQALAIRTAVEGWHRLRPRCMGTIYWQLNDVWPVASWASLEYDGSWKQLHHHARRFFAPLSVAAVPADGKPDEVELWVVNDRPAATKAAVTVEVWGFDGTRHETLTLDAEVAAGSAHLLGSFPIARFCPTADDRTRRFLELNLAATVDGRQEGSRNQHYFARYKACELAKAVLTTSVSAGPGGSFRVRLEADRPALWAVAEVAGVPGRFDDNSVTVLPGRPLDLVFTPRTAATLDQVRQGLAVKHLRQTY